MKRFTTKRYLKFSTHFYAFSPLTRLVIFSSYHNCTIFFVLTFPNFKIRRKFPAPVCFDCFHKESFISSLPIPYYIIYNFHSRFTASFAI